MNSTKLSSTKFKFLKGNLNFMRALLFLIRFQKAKFEFHLFNKKILQRENTKKITIQFLFLRKDTFYLQFARTHTSKLD
jgi:hypothetical protein